MGRNKSSLRLGGRTMLGHIRVAVAEASIPSKVIKEDVVNRCGPLGGIYTGLKQSRAELVLFLACDMPFVTPELIRWFVGAMKSKDSAVFASHGDYAGFPILFCREACVEAVEGQIRKGKFSLQKLAQVVDARLIPPGRKWIAHLENVNTPKDLETARMLMAQRKKGAFSTSKTGLS